MPKKVLSNLISSILIFIIATSSIFIVYVAICVDDKSIFGYRIFNVISGSMSGTIEKGELLVTKKVSPEELKTGMIITFISNAPDIKGKFNTHRIVWIDGNIIHTKGDANYYTDKEFVKIEDIVGKVIWHSNLLGKVISWTCKPVNMLCFIILPVVLIAFCDVRKGFSLIRGMFGKKKGKRIIRKRVVKTALERKKIMLKR